MDLVCSGSPWTGGQCFLVTKNLHGSTLGLQGTSGTGRMFELLSV